MHLQVPTHVIGVLLGFMGISHCFPGGRWKRDRKGSGAILERFCTTQVKKNVIYQVKPLRMRSKYRYGYLIIVIGYFNLLVVIGYI